MLRYVIYQTTNTVTGKVYVGKHRTHNLEDSYLGSGKLLKRAINKYGREYFVRTILSEHANQQELDEAERALVTAEFCQREDTYNICEGGRGGFGFINSSELRNGFERDSSRAIDGRKAADKILESKYGHRWRQELGILGHQKIKSLLEIDPNYIKDRQSPSHGFAGKFHTPETISKMKMSHAGKHVGTKNSQFGTYWITDGVANKKISAGTIIPDGWIKGRKYKLKQVGQDG